MAGKKNETVQAEPDIAAQAIEEAQQEPTDASKTLEARINAIEQAFELLSAEVTETRRDLSEMVRAMKDDQAECLEAFSKRLDQIQNHVRGLRPLPGNEPVLTQEELLRLIAEHKQNPNSEGPTSQYAGKPLHVVAAAAFSHGSIGTINKGSIFLVADNAEKIVELVARGLMIRHYTGE